jgi:hypothetical protein
MENKDMAIIAIILKMDWVSWSVTIGMSFGLVCL